MWEKLLISNFQILYLILFIKSCKYDVSGKNEDDMFCECIYIQYRVFISAMNVAYLNIDSVVIVVFQFAQLVSENTFHILDVSLTCSFFSAPFEDTLNWHGSVFKIFRIIKCPMSKKSYSLQDKL